MKRRNNRSVPNTAELHGLCPTAEELYGGFHDQEKGHQQGNRATVLCGR